MKPLTECGKCKPTKCGNKAKTNHMCKIALLFLFSDSHFTWRKETKSFIFLLDCSLTFMAHDPSHDICAKIKFLSSGVIFNISLVFQKNFFHLLDCAFHPISENGAFLQSTAQIIYKSITRIS